jgi:guanylate kinase
MRRHGLIIVVSAPSGAGKSTLCSRLVRKLPRLKYSISYTTRPPRPGEKDGVDYFFTSVTEFREMMRGKKFVEWACVHGNYYGTPKHFLEKETQDGNDIVLDIDVQGGEKIRETFTDAVMIFIMAPSMSVLERRLRGRKKDSEDVIRRRLRDARKEIRYLPKYTYLVINDDLARATRDMEAIIAAEHLKLKHRTISGF